MQDNNNIDNKEQIVTDGINKEIVKSLSAWSQNVTVIDLSNKNITSLDEKVYFPPNVAELNFSHNNLVTVPNAVMTLESLKTLDLSYNFIQFFDDTPNFCQTIESLNMSNNSLQRPPYWVWYETPTNLSKLNLNYNVNITKSLRKDYYEVLLMYTTPVTHLEMSNCIIHQYKGLLGTFQKVKVLKIGAATASGFSNIFHDFPFKGLECHDIERLNVSNTKVCNIRPNIETFKNLIEINLSGNLISNLPRELCNLVNLEVCILSHNDLMYLPQEVTKLKKLIHLYIDYNSLAVLPENISELTNLRTLDVYDNCIYEIPDQLKDLPEIDLAQNYFDEPDDADYLEKRAKLRFKRTDRIDGRKIETVQSENESTQSDSESLHSSCANDGSLDETELQNVIHELSSDESVSDWDSDDYWIPNYADFTVLPRPSWLSYVKKKIAEGVFCPIDLHTVAIADQVEYEKLHNPPVVYESDGQFDDLSDDDC